MPRVSMASGAGVLRGGNSLDRSKTLSSASPSGPLRRLPREIVRCLKLLLGSNRLATGANDLLKPVTGGINVPMGTGGAILIERIKYIWIKYMTKIVYKIYE